MYIPIVLHSCAGKICMYRLKELYNFIMRLGLVCYPYPRLLPTSENAVLSSRDATINMCF